MPSVTTARVADRFFEFAPDHIMKALASTISYRLEPEGWSSRFPFVLDHLLAGRLSPSEGSAAIAELEAIEWGLKRVPRDSVVWDRNDRRRRDDSREEVCHTARDASEYFLARSGRPLLHELKEAVHE